MIMMELIGPNSAAAAELYYNNMWYVYINIGLILCGKVVYTVVH